MKSTVIGVYDKYEDVIETIEALDNAGIDKEYISVLGKGNENVKNRFEYYKHSQDAAFWGTQGAFWGAIMGFLVGGFLSWIPGVGPVIAAGPLMNALAGLAAGAVVGGAGSALVAVLVDWGLTEKEALRYENFIKEGKFLVLIHADEDVIDRAQKVLENHTNREVKRH
ncbi:general stress protein [Hydrogenimonas sp.]